MFSKPFFDVSKPFIEYLYVRYDSTVVYTFFLIRYIPDICYEVGVAIFIILLMKKLRQKEVRSEIICLSSQSW